MPSHTRMTPGCSGQMIRPEKVQKERRFLTSVPVAGEQETLRGDSPTVVLADFGCVDSLTIANLKLPTWSLTVELGRDVKNQLCALVGSTPAHHLPAVRTRHSVTGPEEQEELEPRDQRRRLSR